MTNLLHINSYTPNFKASRTNFNNTELVSLNAIFNPITSLKIKTLGFFNWDENDFFKTTKETVEFTGVNFTNNENRILRKKKIVGFGKIDLTYDVSKTKTLEWHAKYSNYNEDSKNRLVFNTLSTIENVETNTTSFDHKITFTNKIKKKKVFLLTGRYIHENSPENYVVNQFFYPDLFPDISSTEVTQVNNNSITFAGVEAHLIDRKPNGNLVEIQFGNQFRNDKLVTSLGLMQGEDVMYTPIDYQNRIRYSSNDLYLKSKFLLKQKKTSLIFKFGAHQFLNQLEKENKKEETPFYINPKIRFEWMINDENKISTSYSYTTTNSNILDLYDSYVLLSSRSFSRGTGDFDQLNSSSVMFNYQLGNWGDKFFSNILLFYNNYHDFYTRNSMISQNYSKSDKILMKGKELLSVASNIDRYFKGISTNLKLNFGFSSANYKNIVNSSSIREIRSHTYYYGFELRSGFRGVFNYHVGFKWDANSIKSSLSNSFTNNTSFLDLSFVFNRNFNIDLQTERYFFDQVNEKESTYYFADFKANYTIKKNKLIVSLVGKNLFDTDTFKEFSINDIGSSTTEYRLLPRYLLLKMKYMF